MIDIQALNDKIWVSTTFDLFRVAAANFLGGYEISDPVDAALVNTEVILTIITEKCVSRGLEFFVPRFSPKNRFGNFKNGALFYLAAGVSSSSLLTTAIYPLRVIRARRKANKALKNAAPNVVVIDDENNELNASPAPPKEEKMTLLGGLLCGFVNIIPNTIDIAIDYARGNTEKLVIIAMASTFAIAQYSITGGYRKIVRKIFPKALP